MGRVFGTDSKGNRCTGSLGVVKGVSVRGRFGIGHSQCSHLSGASVPAAFPSLGMKTRNELLALTAVPRAPELMLAVVNHAAVSLLFAAAPLARRCELMVPGVAGGHVTIIRRRGRLRPVRGCRFDSRANDWVCAGA